MPPTSLFDVLAAGYWSGSGVRMAPFCFTNRKGGQIATKSYDSGCHRCQAGGGRHGCQRGFGPRCRRRVLRPAGFHRSYRQRLFIEHDLGESSGSTVDVARRGGYPWPEQMARKMLRNVEKRGVQAARNGPSEDSKCWQRIELGIHGLNRWAVNCLEMSRKRGVQAARNGPSLPPCVAKAEMSTADRLGSREGSSRAGPPQGRGVSC
jgi:hypothetical protein